VLHGVAGCCNALNGAAERYSVLGCGLVLKLVDPSLEALQYVAICCSEALQYVAVCYSVLRCDLVFKLGGQDSCGSVLLSVAVRCSVLQDVAV